MTSSDKPADDTGGASAAAPTFSFSLEQYCREKLENIQRELPEAARQLKAAGVAHVVITYDGCGDEGQIQDIAYRDAEGQPIDPSGKVSITEDALLDLFYDLTQARHPGWENNEGAYGAFEWDLAADTLRHRHNDRFTDYHTTEHEGL